MSGRQERKTGESAEENPPRRFSSIVSRLTSLCKAVNLACLQGQMAFSPQLSYDLPDFERSTQLAPHVPRGIQGGRGIDHERNAGGVPFFIYPEPRARFCSTIYKITVYTVICLLFR